MGKFSSTAVLCDLSVCVCVCVCELKGEGEGGEGEEQGKDKLQNQRVDRRAESWGPPVLYDLHSILKALKSWEGSKDLVLMKIIPDNRDKRPTSAGYPPH